MASRYALPLAVAAAGLTFATARDAAAHKVGLSRGDYVVHGATVDAEIVFEKGEVAQLAPDADSNRDGALDREELVAGRAALERSIVGRIAVLGDGARCDGKLVDAIPVEGDGVMLHARYTCAARPDSVSVTIALFGDLSHGHRHLATVRGGAADVDAVAFAAQPSFGATLGHGGSVPDASATQGSSGGAWSLFVLGIEHILTGYDHLVFLLGLVLVGGRIRSLLGVITAFTIAHSITLALAALGVWAPSPRFVEPAIALSIAYVGVENFFVQNAEKRWRITFPFGLIHGFGFAGALAEIDLPRAKVPLALVMFNLGVEVGQLGVVGVVLPLIMVLSRHKQFRTWGVRGGSAAIVVAGLVWFVARITSM